MSKKNRTRLLIAAAIVGAFVLLAQRRPMESSAGIDAFLNRGI